MTGINEALDRAKHPDGVHRDFWKRPIYPVPGEPSATTKCKACDGPVPGRPFTRMTRFIDVLDDKFALERWFQRQVLKGVVLKDHLVLKASNVLNPNDPQAEKNALDDVCKEAAEAAGTGDAADKGTELHRLIERIARGEKAPIPTAFRPDVEALTTVLSDHKLTASPDDMEINVVLDGVRVQPTAWGIGGRFDVLFTMPAPCPTCGRLRRVGDYKTGQVWYHGCTKKQPCGQEPAECPRRKMYGADEFRMQLAGYASARRVDPATGERTDLNVCQCWGLVVHLPAGEGACELLLADLERGRAGLRQAYQVWLWRAGNSSLDMALPPDIATSTPSPGPAALPSQSARHTPEAAGPDIHTVIDVTGRPDIHGLIDMAGDPESVRNLWRQYVGNGWAYGHELHARRKIAALEGTKT